MNQILDPVLWRVTTGSHNWRATGYLEKLFLLWESAGLIGSVEWATTQDDTPLKIADSGKAAETLLKAPQRGGEISATVGGSNPHAWQASLILSHFDETLGRTDGYSIVNLQLPRSVCVALTSARLLDTFERAHSPNDTKFAGLHPKAHWTHLQADVFVPALTISPMFAGVYWADFLGPGTVELFKREAIDKLAVARRRWHGTKGVFLAVTEDLASADTPETEDRLAMMTNSLRGSFVAEA